jgi:HEAT repeat protein
MTLERLLAAIAAGDDDTAEQQALLLTVDDESALVALASAADVDERWWAVRGLAVCGGEAAVPALAAVLRDSDSGVRAAAALAAHHVYLRNPTAAQPLLALVAGLLADDDGMVRHVAADALAQSGDDAVPALGEVLRTSPHEGARTRAAAALRKIATLRAAALLYPLLNDPNPLVRMYAYEGLDEMGLLENILLVP